MLSGQKPGIDWIIQRALLIVALAIALYLPSLGFEFTNWDDNIYVTQNALIHKLTADRTVRIFTTFQLVNYHPLTLLSYAIQYHWFHQNPMGYHLINIILHGMNGFLVLIFVLSLGQSGLLAFMTALAFVMHPLQVESVAWISSQKTLLSAFFSLLTLIIYTAFAKSNNRKFYWISFLFYIFAVLSKPTATPLPLLLFMLDKKFRSANLRQRLQAVIPFVIPAVLEAGLVLIAHRSGKALVPISGGGIWPHSVIPFWTIFFQLNKVFFPIALLPLYPPLREVGWLNPEYLFPALVTILGIVLAILWCKKFPTFSMGTAFYVILLLPTINLLPLISPVADRYLYLPLMAPLLLIMTGITSLYGYCRHIFARVFIAVAFVLLIGTLFFSTRRQMSYWHDSETLWKYVIRKVPNHGMAHIKLADYYYEQGDLDKAIAYDLKGIKLGLANPYFAKNLVAMYIDKGEFDRARESALSFLKLTPFDERLYIQLGMIESNSAPDKAENYFRKAIELNPQNAYVWYEMGRFYLKTRKDVSRAYTNFLKSITLNPYEADFHIGVGACLAQRGDYQRSLEALRYALSLDENKAAAWFNLGHIFELQGNKELARSAIRKALELDPKLVEKLKEWSPKEKLNGSR